LGRKVVKSKIRRAKSKAPKPKFKLEEYGNKQEKIKGKAN